MQLTKPILLVSDVHLSEHRPQLTALFLAFLRGPARQASALYILGDLFDVWVGEDVSFPFHADIHRAFKELEALQISLFFVAGNRDFLLSSRYLKRIGCSKLPEKTIISMHGIPTLLMHGDLLCTQDKGYQWYRAIAQHPITQQLFLILPKQTRQKIGRKLREKSRRYQQGKPLSILDADPISVQQAISRSGALQFIHGHVHRAAIHHEKVDNRNYKRVVLGDWNEKKGSVVICTPYETSLADFNEKEGIVIKDSYALKEAFPEFAD